MPQWAGANGVCPGAEDWCLTILDLGKATLVCGGGSYLVYECPLVGQVFLISVLGLVWLLYLRQALNRSASKRKLWFGSNETTGG